MAIETTFLPTVLQDGRWDMQWGGGYPTLEAAVEGVRQHFQRNWTSHRWTDREIRTRVYREEEGSYPSAIVEVWAGEGDTLGTPLALYKILKRELTAENRAAAQT